MIAKDMLQVGEKIEIILQTQSNNAEQKPCYSMVQDKLEDDEFIITLPVRKAQPVLLEVGEILDVSFYRINGLFYFVARVIERFKSENMILFKIKRISPVRRLQRRMFFRLNATVMVLYKVIDYRKNSMENDFFCKGYTIDISGGGLRMVTSHLLEINSRLECKIFLDEWEISVKGRVLRVSELHDEQSKFEVAICFEDISEKTRDQIIAFIFKKQRELKKKGLI